jgi:hypothetical protein
MGNNKKTRIKIEGLERQIAHHGEKIAEERQQHNPNEGLIRHWQNEVTAWKGRLTRLKRRLPGRK